MTLLIKIAALLCLAGLVASSGIAMCPNTGVADLYNASSPCAPYDSCRSSYCSCIGAQAVDPMSDLCIWGTNPAPTCATVQNCLNTLMPCLNNAAASNGCSNAPSLSALRIQMLDFGSGTFYNGSTAEMACQYHTCRLINNSVSQAGGCSAASTACVAPYVYNGIITLTGTWTAVTVSESAIESALAMDMTAKFQMNITVQTAQSGSASLVATFQAPVAGGNTMLQSAIASAQSSSTWLTHTQSLYGANGGVGQIAVSSIIAQTAPPTTQPPTASPNEPVPSYRFKLSYVAGTYNPTALRQNLMTLLGLPSLPNITIVILAGTYETLLSSWRLQELAVNTVTEIQLTFFGPNAEAQTTALYNKIQSQGASSVASSLGASGISAESTSSSPPSKTGMIVGIVIGCVVGVALIVVGVVCFTRRRAGDVDQELLEDPKGAKMI